MRPAIPLAVACLVCASSASALDARRAPSQYVIATWGPSTLGSTTVRALLQTQDGYLWLGTEAGLVRHDGIRFVVFDATNTPVLGDGGVSSLAEGTDGSLYIGTAAGAVIRYKDGAFTSLAVRKPTGPAQTLLASRDGSVWIGQYGRPVARWERGREAVYFLKDVATVTPLAIAEDASGVVWVGSADGLWRFEGDGFRRGKAVHDAVQALCVDRSGALWIGTRHGLLRSRGDRVERFAKKNGLPDDSISALTVDRQGNLWVGTPAGLGRLSEGRFATLTSEHGLPDDDVRSLGEDREGNLWVGTGAGLARLNDGAFLTYGRLEGLRDPAVSAVIAAQGGGVWLGTASAEVVKLAPEGRLETFRLPGGRGSEAVTALHEERDGTLWVAMENGRVFSLENRTVHEHTPVVDRRERERVAGFFEDEDGIGVLVMRRALARLRGTRVVPLYEGGHKLQFPHALHRDRRGVRWVAGSSGLARVGDRGYTLFGEQEGLPHPRVRWISEDEDGALWLATGGGLARFKDGTFEHVGIREGLPENHLRVVLDDGLGFLWIAGQGSLCRISKHELLDVFAGKSSRVSPLRFDVSDGLRTTEALLSNSPAFRSEDGRLWFATAKGVSVVDPRRVSLDGSAPPVILETLRVDGESADPRRYREYPPGRGEVGIEYAALAFAASRKVQFRHRLEGLDHDWIPAGSRRYAYYGALPPGRYRFQVMASSPDGVWGGAPASLEFAIRPAFVRTPFFFALCVLAGVSVVAAGHRLRVGQMRARLAAVLRERTRIARELHDTLAQAVTGTGLQIETGLRVLDQNPVSARAHMRRAHALARSSLAEVRRSIWVLRAQTSRGPDDLGATLARSLGQLTSDTGPRATLDVSGRPRRLPMALERHLLRIVHEAVTNAARHSGAALLTVVLEFGEDALVLRVRDDGCGFDVEKHLAASGSEHFGLIGIVERTRILGGSLSVASRPGEGTEVVCRLPYGAVAAADDADDDENGGAEA